MWTSQLVIPEFGNMSCYVSTCTLLCKHGWCENHLKNVSQPSQCAQSVGHIGTRDGAHWDYMLVKENKCKTGGKYIFWTRCKQRMWGSQPVKWTWNNTVKIIFGWNKKIRIWNVKRCYQYHYHILWHIGTMSQWDNVPLCPKEIVPICPTCPWKSIQGKCLQKIKVRIENFKHGHANMTCY